MPTTGRTRAAVAIAALALLAVAASCSNDGDGGGTGDNGSVVVPSGEATSSTPPASDGASATPTGPQAFAGRGPYPVGTLEVDAPNGPITVWYPAEPGSEVGAQPATYDMRGYLPPAEQAKVAAANDVVFTEQAFTDLPAAEPESRPFPLVLFSHGFCGFRQQSSYLTTAIASWGFVVAAPEHSARDLTSCLSGTIGQGASSDVDDLRAALPVMEAENLRDDGPLATRVDTSRVAVVGHSAGGSAALQMSADPQIATFVALAAGNGNPPAKPGLFVAGDADAIAPAASIEQWWNTTVPSPRQLAVLGGVTHLGFMEACTIAADRGGILQVASDAGIAVPEVIVRMYADGCDPKYTPAPTAWPAIQHLTIAQLRAGLGIDPAPVGLDASLTDAYDGLTIRYQAA
jgi:dienelactone hydrolase